MHVIDIEAICLEKLKYVWDKVKPNKAQKPEKPTIKNMREYLFFLNV